MTTPQKRADAVKARWRKIVRMRDVSKKTFKEIGEAHDGISPQAAQKLYNKGKALERGG